MLKDVAVSAILMTKDIYGTICIIVGRRVNIGIYPINANECYVTDTFVAHGAAGVKFSTCATHLMIVLQSMIWFWKAMLKFTPFNSRLVTPDTNYVVQNNTASAQQKNNIIANMYVLYITCQVTFVSCEFNWPLIPR